VDFEQGVNHCIKELRAALGDAAEVPRYIQTIPRRGYKLIAPVERIDVGTTGSPTGSASAPSSGRGLEPSSPSSRGPPPSPAGRTAPGPLLDAHGWLLRARGCS
jgi:DNA-binding winged helix-turn-helix (wHTH) protein